MWALAALLFWQAANPSSDGLKALNEHRYEAAVQAFTKAIEADPKDYTAHFNLALAYGFLNKDAEAIAEYRKTLELKPGLYEAQINGGMVLLREKQPAGALPLLEAAAKQKPKEFRPLYYLAEAQLQTGALADAEASYRAALALDAKSANAELGLAHALARQGKLDDAAPHFRTAAQLDPRLRTYLLELAGLYETNHRPAQAIEICREFPDDPAAQEHLGELMLETKAYAGAVPSLEAAYNKSPTEANRAALAAAYVFTKQLDKAIPLLQQAVAAAPSNYDIRMMYARALRDGRQFQPAAAQFYAAAKLKPADYRPWSELGGMLYMANDFPQALAAFDRARDLGENTAGNWFMRAIILDKLSHGEARNPKLLKPALDAYRQFLTMSQGKNPDQEFQARHRSKFIEGELEKR